MKTVHNNLPDAISDLFGADVTVAARRRVHGGDINDAFALTLSDGRTVFMKTNSAELADMFVCEAAGLAAIAAAGAIRTPEVYCTGIDGARAFLLMEWRHARPRILGDLRTRACSHACGAGRPAFRLPLG